MKVVGFLGRHAFSLHHLLSQSLSCSCVAAGQAGCAPDFQPHSGQAGGTRLLSLTRGVRVGASEASLYCTSPPGSKVGHCFSFQNGSSQPDCLHRPVPAPPPPADSSLFPGLPPGPWDGQGGSPSPPSCTAQKHFTPGRAGRRDKRTESPPRPGKSWASTPVQGSRKETHLLKPNYTAY